LPPPLVAVVAAGGLAAALTPGSMRSFLLGLPVSFYVVLPKWLCDDWQWRTNCHEARLRRLLVRVLIPFTRPPWDASWAWDDSRAGAYWAGLGAGAGVRLRSACKGVALSVSLDEEVQPAVPPMRPRAQNGTATAAPAATGPMLEALSGLIERAGGNPQDLGMLDSLQAITLAEFVRKEMGLAVSVADVLRSGDAGQLAAKLARAGAGAHSQGPNGMMTSSQGCGSSGSGPAAGRPDAQGAYRVFLMEFPRMPVDWLVRHTGPGHLDVAALQRAADRLVSRHSALRTVQSPDDAVRTLMDKAAAVWQMWVSALGRESRAWRSLSRLVGGALFACWPRTVLRSPAAARLELKFPKGTKMRDERWDSAADDEYVHSAVKELVFDHRWPFDIAVVPLYRGQPAGPPGANALEVARTLPPESVAWYIYCGITHCFSDGASGQALFGDLLRFYAEESGQATRQAWAEAPEHLGLLQRRLRPSLCGRLPTDADPNNDVFHEVACEDWGRRHGFSSRLFLDAAVMGALRTAATDVLGCGLDVAWLTAVMGAMFRLFPEHRCMRLMLKVACRDGPGEVQMVGFLSEQRILTVDVLDPETSTLLGIAGDIAAARRSRAWRAPAPFESGLCIYVNIVSAMVDGLPPGFRHVVRPAGTPTNWHGTAYAHLNLRIDQIATSEWDFRIFHWDAAWGWSWCQCFAHALASAIGDMASAPTAPLLRPPSLVSRQATSSPAPGQPQKRGVAELDGLAGADAERGGQGPPAKLQRTAAAADVAAGAALGDAVAEPAA